jgi:outer membrane protein OmpA-like peptidoglycan-associated protein
MAQDDFTLRIGHSLYLLETSIPPVVAEPYLMFSNLNQIPYYENNRLMRKILQANKQNNISRLDSLLTYYISNFGIENFKEENDLDLIWRLGQIKERLRDTLSAMMYYSLALKNQSRYRDSIRKHYDTLAAAKVNKYVDIDFYYRLVEARTRIDTLKPPKGVLLNMGKHINSAAPDYAPFMHPSNQVLLFTSRRTEVPEDWNNNNFEQNEDLYYTMFNPLDSTWSPAQRFTRLVNSFYNEGSACLNYEGNKLIFSRCNAPDSYGICDLYEADYDVSDFAEVRNLGEAVNSEAWESHPCLTPDGQTLFFTSNRAGGFGGMDIWMTRKLPNGKWGPAENLGPVINTLENEVTPFFHPINNTLYFSSTGHLNNNGGYDIYKTYWNYDHWTEPRNLGPLVNTPRDEYYFSIDGKGEKLFYANARKSNPLDFDLYSFPMPMAARPDAVVKLKGYLIDSVTNRPITGIVVAIDLDKQTEIEPIYLTKNGYFEFSLVNNRHYQLMILGDNAVTVHDSVYLQKDTAFTWVTKSIDLSKPIIFESLQYEVKQAAVTPNIEPQLQYLIRFLKKNPGAQLIIRGHTDADGDEEKNRLLSQERADNIKKYILKHVNISDTAIIAEGVGESEPVYPNDSPEHKAQNRRVEFRVIMPEKAYDRLPIASKEEKDKYTDSVDIKIGDNNSTEEKYDPEFNATRNSDENEYIDDDARSDKTTRSENIPTVKDSTNNTNTNPFRLATNLVDSAGVKPVSPNFQPSKNKLVDPTENENESDTKEIKEEKEKDDNGKYKEEDEELEFDDNLDQLLDNDEENFEDEDTEEDFIDE